MHRDIHPCTWRTLFKTFESVIEMFSLKKSREKLLMSQLEEVYCRVSTFFTNDVSNGDWQETIM